MIEGNVYVEAVYDPDVARRAATLVIEDICGETPRPHQISLLPGTMFLCLSLWRGRAVNLHMHKIDDGLTAVMSLFHCALPHLVQIRPWSRTYPTAQSLLEAAGAKILRALTWEEYHEEH